MGRGYDPTGASSAPNGALDPSGQTYALLPNQAFFPQPSPLPAGGLVDPAGPGGANVDYTAPDYNNMYLGLAYEFQRRRGSAACPAVVPST